jgi:hypothetical protein
MINASFYKEQANLFFRLAIATRDCEQAAQLEAQGRMFLRMATKKKSPGAAFAQLGKNSGMAR